MFFNTPTFTHIGLNKVHYEYASQNKAVQFCMILRDKKNWRADHAGWNESVVLPLIKATTRSKDRWNNQIKGGRKIIVVIVPIVIYQGPLYIIQTDAPEITPVSVDHVTLIRNIDGQGLKGCHRIEFIRPNYLSRFITERLSPVFERISQIVQTSPDLVVRQQQ